MRIVLLDHVGQTVLDRLLGSNTDYRPDLLRKNPETLVASLVALTADAIITRSVLPVAAVEQWAEGRGAPVYYVRIAAETEAPPGDDASVSSRVFAGVVRGSDEESTYVAALEMLERQFTRRRAEALARPMETSARSADGNTVLLVGAGLVNLITAHTLQRAGYSVRLVDSGPDPRNAAAWGSYGASRGGDDARMFTLSEMDSYNDRELSASMNSQFRRPVDELGWNVHFKGTLSRVEEAWISEFESIPIWLAKRYNDDIFAFSRESKSLWERWIHDDPELFQASVLREGILRIYSDPTRFAAQVRRQDYLGATKKVLSADAVAAEHPALADAVSAGRIAGGIFVVGFTINAHKFMHQLLDRLERGGAVFEWNQPARNLLFDAQGHVRGVRTLSAHTEAVHPSSSISEAAHYVVSPGAYGDALLGGTRSHGRIHGVLGVWLRLPNLTPPLTHSLKLARTGHITEDANITVATDAQGQPVLIIGSGYGHTGVDARNIDGRLLARLYQGMADTAEKYFPRSHERAVLDGTLEASFKYCVRPWTASSLGIFEMLPARGGGRCVITGGHNTGGFAQAPAVAQAVLAAVSGREHAMHESYDPERSSAFLSTSHHADGSVGNARAQGRSRPAVTGNGEHAVTRNGEWGLRETPVHGDGRSPR